MPRSGIDIPDFGGDEEMRGEMVRIFSSRQFRRSPVMRKLLGFLVAESLAGRGDRLKAYTIAVDALGKPPSFDAQGDAYPRVQAGRLRALLDEFYDENGEEAGLRFAIPKGGYVVTFRSEDMDGPEAGTTESAETVPAKAQTMVPAAAPDPPNDDHPSWEQLRFWRFAASIFAAIALGLIVLRLAGGPAA